MQQELHIMAYFVFGFLLLHVLLVHSTQCTLNSSIINDKIKQFYDQVVEINGHSHLSKVEEWDLCQILYWKRVQLCSVAL